MILPSVFLSRIIEKTITQAYKLVCKTQLSTAGTSSSSGAEPNPGSSSLNRSFINLPKELFEMLASAGPYLYRDTLLLQKVYHLHSGIFTYWLLFHFLKFIFPGHCTLCADNQSAERLLPVRTGAC